MERGGMKTHLLAAALSAFASLAFAADRPNIVYILCDDLGYGDVHALNPSRGKIPTPQLDRLTTQGMVFTDAHGGSSVCTPTRYGILTGRYAWRTRLQAGVLFGDSPHLIEPGLLTVPALLRDHGYATAAIGKWHLGMEWAQKATKDAAHKGALWNVDYTKPVRNGPTAVGFDSFFGVCASLDAALPAGCVVRSCGATSS